LLGPVAPEHEPLHLGVLGPRGAEPVDPAHLLGGLVDLRRVVLGLLVGLLLLLLLLAEGLEVVLRALAHGSPRSVQGNPAAPPGPSPAPGPQRTPAWPNHSATAWSSTPS